MSDVNSRTTKYLDEVKRTVWRFLRYIPEGSTEEYKFPVKTRRSLSEIA